MPRVHYGRHILLLASGRLVFRAGHYPSASKETRALRRRVALAISLLASVSLSCGSADGEAERDPSGPSGEAPDDGGAGSRGSNGSTSAAADDDAGALVDAAGATARPLYESLGCDLTTALSYCGGGTCHYDSASQDVGSSLVLWDRDAQQINEGLEARLINAPAEYHNVVTGDCPSEPELLVNTDDVEQSLLLKKLLGTHSCGDAMPKFPYPEWGTVENPGTQREELVDCFRQWLSLLVADYAASR